MSQDKLTKLARGMPCMGRFPTICNGNNETTVLAHLNMIGISGRSLKAPSLLGAWLCSACHDETDRRTTNLEKDSVRVMYLEAVMRTQYELILRNIVKW